MKRRIAVLGLACALASLFVGTSAFANCNPGDPPTPATGAGVAVVSGTTAVIAFGGESDTCWTTDGIGHSHEWNAEGIATASISGNVITISQGSIAIAWTFEPITGLVLGNASGVPGVPGAIGAGWVNTTGVVAGVLTFAGI